MAHALVKLEVSQKQAYIFSSNKLKDNVLNSAVIAWIMSPDYFADIVKADGREELFSETENLVYSGGGHIVLDYEEKETAVSFVRLITSQIHKEYSGIEIIYFFTHSISVNMYKKCEVDDKENERIITGTGKKEIREIVGFSSGDVWH